MSCPQCSSTDVQRNGSRENYNMAKGMVGQAVGGTIGSLAGFENQTVWKCNSCGCLFVEGLNRNKILVSGIGGDSYLDIGTEPVEVKGYSGYSYKIRGIHLDISLNDNYRENHFEIPTFERVEYRLDIPVLTLYYLCKDGRVRSKSYTDLSRENLEKLITEMKKALEAFHKFEHYDFFMRDKKETQIVEITADDKTYKQAQNSGRLVLSAIISVICGLFALKAGGGAFLATTVIAFPIAYITLLLKKKE